MNPRHKAGLIASLKEYLSFITTVKNGLRKHYSGGGDNFLFFLEEVQFYSKNFGALYDAKNQMVLSKKKD